MKAKERILSVFRQRRLPFAAFWLSISLLYALSFTAIEFSDNPWSGFGGFAALAMQWAIVAVCTSGLLCVISVSKYVFAAMYPLLIVLSTALAYFKLTMGQSITPMVIELAVVNDAKTWATNASWLLIASMIAATAISALIAAVRFKYVRIGGRAAWAYLLVGAGLFSLSLVPRFNAAVMNRMPMSAAHAVDGYLDNRLSAKESRDTYDKTDVQRLVAESPDVVVVIGESLRADHLPQNGYARNTMPLMSAEANAVVLPHVYTEAWCTHTSVPRIMTRADAANPEAAYEEQSFISLFKNADYHTSWISNQDTNPTYIYFMREADTLVMTNAAKSLYGFDKWLDADMLPEIRATLDSASHPQLVVIHSIGSHWWYRSHYTEGQARFRPEIDSRILSEVTDEQLRNSYDNTIVATDEFLRNVTEMLRGRNAIMIFISDHGDALGEDGHYLHAEDSEWLHNPACLVWYSPEYASAFPEKVRSLKLAAQESWTTDAIFHSVLDAASLECAPLDRSQSFFGQGE